LKRKEVELIKREASRRQGPEGGTEVSMPY
jgi:hypothetical protein